jgi:rubrerythrin
MAAFRGSRTERNLLTAFAGESQARNRYTYFAGAARSEGLMQIDAIFLETADHEKEHAKRFFKFLQGGEVQIAAAFPAGTIGTTADNLKAAAAGEHHEWSSMYPEFARVAREEGFAEIANVFEAVAAAEKFHESRYQGLLANVQAGKVFLKDRPVVWKCRNCGFLHEGPEAPKACRACAHPQAYFELFAPAW